LTCWKWFNSVLEEANVTLTDKNKAKVDDVIHKFIDEQSRIGKCHPNGKKPAWKLRKIRS
jgi:hypothetical protein